MSSQTQRKQSKPRTVYKLTPGANQRAGKPPHSGWQCKGSVEHPSLSIFFCSKQLPFQMMGKFTLIASLSFVSFFLREQDTVLLPASSDKTREAGRSEEPEEYRITRAPFPYCRQSNFPRQEERSHREVFWGGLHQQERFS